jgi:hypothetical protein
MNIEMNQEQNLQLQRILMNSPWREVSWIMDELEEKLAMDLVREDSMYEKAVADAERISKALVKPGRPRKVSK